METSFVLRNIPIDKHRIVLNISDAGHIVSKFHTIVVDLDFYLVIRKDQIIEVQIGGKDNEPIRLCRERFCLICVELLRDTALVCI
jgi:hypothetical protein